MEWKQPIYGSESWHAIDQSDLVPEAIMAKARLLGAVRARRFSRGKNEEKEDYCLVFCRDNESAGSLLDYAHTDPEGALELFIKRLQEEKANGA